VVAAEPFGRLEEIGPGIWALISTPLAGDMTTVSNGAIVAGRSGVLAIEGLFRPAGAKWLAERARELTGKWPTHLVISHYHGDHVNGLAGYGDGGPLPSVRITAATRDLIVAKNQPADSARAAALAGAILVDPTVDSTIDLGDRQVRLAPKTGHTSSDLVALVDDPAVIVAGDLIWNGMFPNYVDAIPSTLARIVRELRGDGRHLVVPGHGPMAKAADVDRYLDVLAEVERAARAGKDRGQTAAEAAQHYTLPASLGEWTLFTKTFMETAFAAWYRELAG
jgi:glyoxylase-like metal-dependent hydrolase (beta-lactamase superfamily II)